MRRKKRKKGLENDKSNENPIIFEFLLIFERGEEKAAGGVEGDGRVVEKENKPGVVELLTLFFSASPSYFCCWAERR